MPERTLGAAWEAFPFVNWHRQLSALSFAGPLSGISVGAGGVQPRQGKSTGWGHPAQGLYHGI